jgi:hypothetical protein
MKLLTCLNDIVTSEDYRPETKYYAILVNHSLFRWQKISG